MHSKISLFSNFLFGFTVFFPKPVISPTAFMPFLMSRRENQNPRDWGGGEGISQMGS